MITHSEDERSSKNIVKLANDVIETTEALEIISTKAQSEALSALTNLGYAPYDAALALSDVLKDQNKVIEVQELIRLALKNLSPKV